MEEADHWLSWLNTCPLPACCRQA